MTKRQLDSYGSPQAAPAIDSYGSPQAPPQTSSCDLQVRIRECQSHFKYAKYEMCRDLFALQLRQVATPTNYAQRHKLVP